MTSDSTQKAVLDSRNFPARFETEEALDSFLATPSQDLIDALVERAQKIQGVREVENLLHTPGTEAPMHH